MQRLAVVVAGVLFSSGAGAQPPDGLMVPEYESQLPSDFGAVSIESSRRFTRAYMTDWRDDAESIEGERTAVCLLAGVTSSLIGFASPPTLGLLQRLPAFLGGGGGSSAAMPLRAPLVVIETLVPFTRGEREALHRLRERRVEDRSDLIRLVIDTQWFLMRVSKRLYDGDIARHWSRTEGFWGLFRFEAEACAALSLRLARDRELVRAGRRALALYDFLERELTE